MTGVEGWSIHGRAPRPEPLPKRVHRSWLPAWWLTDAQLAVAEAGRHLIRDANRAVGLTDISDATATRIADYLRRDDT